MLNERDKAAPEVKQEGPDADADADAEADEDEGTPKAKTEVKEEVKYEAPSSSPEPSYSATGSASPFAGKKRKSSSSVDEDARLAAELHAELNGGRPSRGTAKAKPGKKAAAKKRATKKKSSDTIDDDLSGTENGEGQLVKKKRKANPNNAFMVGCALPFV